MGAEVMMALSKRGEDLRYVTEHFQDLQGLRVAPFWAFLLASLLFGITGSSGRAFLMTLTAGLLVLVMLQVWARKWYRSRYGVVIKPIAREARFAWQALLMALILGLGLGTTLFRRFENNNLVLPLLLCYVPVLLPRCFDHAASPGLLLRKILYSASLTALLVLTVWFLFGGLGGRRLLETVAGCWLFLSLYDHALLVYVLRVSARMSKHVW